MTHARTGHRRWFINCGSDGRFDQKQPVRCECGATFSGFIAWSDHITVKKSA